MPAQADNKNKMLFREATIDASQMKDGSREIELSFASEQPVQRYDWENGTYYNEVLDHSSAKAADFSRLNNGGALLRDHNRTQQPGVIVKNTARIDADKKSRATVKFSRSGLGEEEFQDVKDGIRTLVSVGYQTGREISRENVAGVETRRFEWMPYEVSTVSIPADTTVGVGREENPPPAKTTQTISQERQIMPETIAAPIVAAPPAAAPSVTAPAAPAVVRSAEDQVKDERKRISEIVAIGRKFSRNDEAQTAISTNQSVDAFRGHVMDLMQNQSTTETATEQTVSGRSVGEIVVANADYRALVEKMKRGGKDVRANFEIPINFAHTRTTGDPATTTGLTSIDKQPGIVLLGQQPPRVADLMNQTPTNNTTIRYISENSLTNAATAVAENGALPEATWDLVETDANIKKIGVIGRVTDEFFQDYDATRDYINNRLAYMVSIKEDNALLNADASANQIKGLLQFTGIQTQAQGVDTALDALYKAINKVRTVGFFEPDAIVMHPNDLQNFRLMKDKNGQYYFGGPFTGSYGQPGSAGFVLMIWGLPVVWTTSIASGTALVGAFRLGAQIFRKLGLTIETTNSDASDFQSNRIAIRANTRLTLACYRPLAFCTVTGLA
jgi:HK97 family phage major capsid protein